MRWGRYLTRLVLLGIEVNGRRLELEEDNGLGGINEISKLEHMATIIEGFGFAYKHAQTPQ